MSKGAAREIAAAKLRGQRVIGETIASGIAAVEGKIWDPDFRVYIPKQQMLAAFIHLVITCMHYRKQQDTAAC